MTQNRKQVTYGKSPASNLAPYMPMPGIPSSGEIAAPAPCSPASSIQPTRTFTSPRNFYGSSSSQGTGVRTVMQRKRRKFVHNESRQDHAHDQMSSHAPLVGVADDPVLRSNENPEPKSPRRDDRPTDGDGISRPLVPVSTSEDDSVYMVPSSSWPSACRWEPTSRPRLLDNEDTERDPSGTPQKTYSNYPRKRLIDSLRAEGDRTRSHSSKCDPAQLFHDDMFGGVELPPASPRPVRKSAQPGIHDSVRFQGNAMAPGQSILRSSGVTYSRQRSFLDDSINMTDNGPRGVGSSFECETNKERHLVNPSGISSEDEEDSNIKPVRSIHELRQAGDNARFREVVGSIFEEIEDIYNSTSGRCCSLAELCGKLADTRFARRFSEHGFDERLVNRMPNMLDTVSACLALSAYKLIITGGRPSRFFFESVWTRIIDLSSFLLHTEDDLISLARASSSGLSKTAQASVRGVRSQLLSAIDSPSPCLSPRLLALECTRSALIALRQNCHTAPSIPAPFLGTLVDISVVKPEALRFPLPPDRFYFLELVFSILENYAVTPGRFDADHCRCLQRLSQLHGLFAADHHGQGREILVSYIRLILNLTNKELTLCDKFADAELVSALVRIVTREFSEVSKDVSVTNNTSLNAVILALGTLINLAEKASRSRAIFLDSGRGTTSFLQQLLEQFQGSAMMMDQAHSVPEVHGNVVAGYLSILLLTICLKKEAREVVKKSTAGDGLGIILSTAEKFLQYHKEIEQDTHIFNTWEEEEFKLTARMGHIISQIRRLERSTMTEQL